MSKDKFYIAIPSYKRHEEIVKKTLSYLADTNVDFRNVFVFVADKKEYKLYHKEINGIENRPKIVIGKHTLRGQRNFIRRYFPKGTWVFFIDDDIEGLYKASTIRNQDLELVVDLNRFIHNGFMLAQKFKITLWGISAVLNAYFMWNKGVSFDLKYIGGGAYGEVLDPVKSLDVELEDKEDFERTIKHFIHSGKVLRFNEYSWKTKGYVGKGGMQETRTIERIHDSAMHLLKKYPEYCKLNTGKKNQKYTEIKLIKQ